VVDPAGSFVYAVSCGLNRDSYKLRVLTGTITPYGLAHGSFRGITTPTRLRLSTLAIGPQALVFDPSGAFGVWRQQRHHQSISGFIVDSNRVNSRL